MKIIISSFILTMFGIFAHAAPIPAKEFEAYVSGMTR